MLERIGNMLDILACGTPQERAEVVADLQKDERLARMEARNRQIREEAHGTK
jgi:RNA polymerase-interacting CarD/CdnL/TRCF family regulator